MSSVSYHATVRGRERMCLTKRALLTQTKRAISRGTVMDNAPEKLKEYLNTAFYQKANRKIYVYRKFVYVIGKPSNTLITVVPLPPEYWKYSPGFKNTHKNYVRYDNYDNQNNSDTQNNCDK